MRTIKYIKQYLLVAFVGIFAASCIDNEPTETDLPIPPVAFNYEVVDEEYLLEFYIYSNIGFISHSAETGEHIWDFGDGSPVVRAGRNDTVVHYFDVAGLYDVTLTVDGRSARHPIMIQDIVPIMTVAPLPEGEVHEVLNTPVSILVELPNPRDLPVRYNWIFPSRTFDEGMSPMTGYAGEDVNGIVGNPGDLIFGNVGSQQVRLQVWLDGRLLQEGRVNVQVAYFEEAPTLYFAVRGRNIMALKLVDNPPAGMQILPYDMGVSVGRMPMNILFHKGRRDDGLLYILDAGTRFTWVDDSEFHNMGNGGIRVMSKDGSRVESMVRTAGNAFNDPYDGFIDGDFLYFTNRNTGILRLPLTTRNETHTFRLDDSSMPWFIRNTGPPMFWLLTYGAMNSGFLKVDDVWWWGKRWNQPGIFRFTEGDIRTSTPSPPITPVSIMTGMHVRSFAWDSRRGFMYFTPYSADGTIGGLYRATIAQMEGIIAPAGLAPFSLTTAQNRRANPIVASSRNEGTVDEPLAITQLALNERTGCVYFGLRSDDPDAVPTGLYRFNFTTNNLELIRITEGMNILGVAVNNTPSKLF